MSNEISQPKIVDFTGRIRQRVEDRHWQLFETRLKKGPTEINKENYTHTNDYRIINRLTKTTDRPQTPIEPNQRWQTFCTQVTTRSKETDRLMSIFHNVWQTNWSSRQLNETSKRRMTDSNLNDKTLLDAIPTTEHDRKVISTILHRTTSSDNVPSDKDKQSTM